MIAHSLGLIVVGKRCEAARWSCSCGACGFCYPDAWTADEWERASALYADAQEAHRRHVAGCLVSDHAGRSCRFIPRWRHYCRTWP